MFTQPSVNQIASTYQGNPQPLAQKVEADKKQHGGIPQDLRQLLALNDITQGRNAMGIQQALQIPTNMPTVAQSLQQQAQQAIQSRLMDQAREQQRLMQKPPVLPMGTPQPRRQPQGIDALETNVGEEYAHGGIIGNVQHFDDGGKTSTLGNLFRGIADPVANFFKEDLEKAEARRKLQEQISETAPGLLEQLTDAERAARLKKVKNLVESGKTPYPQGGPAISGPWDRPTGADDANRETAKFVRQTPGVMDAMDAENKNAPATKVQSNQGGVRVNTGANTNPVGIVSALPPEQTEAYKILSENMRRNPEAEAAALRAKYLAEVGQKDLSIFDKTAAELEARRQKLNAPKAGYDAMMEYLEQVALGGGRRSAESGAIGAARQRQLQLNREAQQNELMDKILELGAKKAEAAYGEKKGLFDLTQAERKNVYDKAYEAAKSVNASDDEAKKLAAQAVENEKNRQNQLKAAAIGAHDNLMSRAQALMKADPKLSLEDAMKRAAMAAGATQMENIDVRRLADYTKAKKDIESQYLPILLSRQTPEGARMRAELAARLAEARSLHGLPPEQGINALPTSTGLPAGVTVTQVK